MDITIRERALRSAKDLYPAAPLDELIRNASVIEAYFANSSTTNIVDFARQCKLLHPVRGAIHFEPKRYMVDALNLHANYDKVCINSARQMGSSTLIVIAALWHALSKPNQRVMVLSSSYTIATELATRMNYSLTSLPRSYPAVKSAFKTEVTFDNNSVITFGALRKDFDLPVLDYLLFDNAAFMPHVHLQFVMKCLDEMETPPKLGMVSTPNLAEGTFHSIWTDSDWEKMPLPWYVDTDRDTKWAAHMRKLLGDAKFKTEYECEFTSA